MKAKSTKYKRFLIGLSTISVAAIPLISLSCSSNSQNDLHSQDKIDQQYKMFSNSILKSNLENNIYFENFNFQGKNETILDLEQISVFLSIANLSDLYNYKFVVKKESLETINIEMKMKYKTSKEYNLTPTNNSLKNKKIKNVKTLDENIKNQIKLQYENWKQNNNVSIKNIKTNEILDSKTGYKNIIPSFLNNNNIKISTNVTLNENFIETFNFDDINGKIEIYLDIISKQNSIPFYVIDQEEERKIVIENFATKKEKDVEIKNIFTFLHGTYNVKNMTNGVVLPYLSSGINSMSRIIELYEEILKYKEEEKLKKTLDLIKNQNQSWYRIETTTSANDINGTVTINWFLFDAFTGIKIDPQNISKSSTFNGMIQLVKVGQDNIKDYSIIDAGFSAYNMLRTLKLDKAEEFKVKSSTIQANEINNSWLLNKTNIKEIFNDLKQNGDYLEFSINEIKFRFKMGDEIIENNTIANDVNGVLKIPFILEMEVSADFDKNTEGEEKQYLKFLSPEKKDSSSGYTSAIRNAFVEVGNFMTNEIENTAIIYDYLATNTNIIINMKKYEYQKEDYDYFLNLCRNNESKVVELLYYEITNEVISNVDSKYSEIVQNILEKFDLKFDLSINSVTIDNQNNEFFTSQVEVKLISNNENGIKYEAPYYKNGINTAFPKVKITVTYK